MNKVVIPAILAVTISIAGIFAFMPIEKAITVHTTIVSDLSGFQVERVVAVNSRTDITTTRSDLIDVKVDKDFQVEIGQFLVDSTSTDGTVIVLNLIIEDGAGNDFDNINFTDVTVSLNTGRFVFPDNGTHSIISLPANWSIVIEGKGGAATSDSKVMIGIIAADDATITIGP